MLLWCRLLDVGELNDKVIEDLRAPVDVKISDKHMVLLSNSRHDEWPTQDEAGFDHKAHNIVFLKHPALQEATSDQASSSVTALCCRKHMKGSYISWLSAHVPGVSQGPLTEFRAPCGPRALIKVEPFHSFTLHTSAVMDRRPPDPSTFSVHVRRREALSEEITAGWRSSRHHSDKPSISCSCSSWIPSALIYTWLTMQACTELGGENHAANPWGRRSRQQSPNHPSCMGAQPPCK
ncbi:hypothetical protein Q8A67_022462 [Cirrhinus molitorella]|uniref:Uncharacterized protein n=1 Tax=Cirrhinus molitorella TaxID=172907 RepID=A0AA88P589_9TELE|nr:hypothetical protein Q8A67_022462 [Cirrhinus molitorella]